MVGSADTTYPFSKEPLAERNKLFSDMIVKALQCDVIRCFQRFSSQAEKRTRSFGRSATKNGLHTLSHSSNPADWETAHQSVVFTMNQLAYFLQALQRTPEGTGNLLDACSIFITSCIGNPNAHTYGTQVPFMLAGRANGNLKRGMHYVGGFNDTTTMVQLSALRAAGAQVPSLGMGANLTTASLSAIMA